MGYTHYFNTRPIRGQAKELEKLYQRAISQCETVAKAYNFELKNIDDKHPHRLSGYTVHAETGRYMGLKINGTKELAHEDFCMREHFSQNETGDFCKTARKPYDTVVVACLIILKHHLGEAFQVESDGNASDWVAGLNLAKSVLKINFSIPKSIRRNLQGVS